MAETDQTSSKSLRERLSGVSDEQRAEKFAQDAKDKEVLITKMAEAYRQKNYSLEDVIRELLNVIEELETEIRVKKLWDAINYVIASSKDDDDDPVLPNFREEYIEDQAKRGNLMAEAALGFNKATQSKSIKTNRKAINNDRMEHAQEAATPMQAQAEKIWKINPTLSKSKRETAKHIQRSKDCPKKIDGTKYSIKQIAKIIKKPAK